MCLIARNEERTLPACLQSVADLVAQMIVLDTGSTDCTREVAAQAGAQVYEFAWVDDFAAARNESIRHATGDWIFWLDADERLDETNRQRLRTLFASLGTENAAYLMKQRSVLEASTYSAAEVGQVRLFRNDARIRWQNRVHEQILPAIRQAGGELRPTDIVIDHFGYQDPAQQGAKVERNFRLLQLELAERPHDPFVLFNLASVHLGQGRSAEAVPLLRRSLELSQPGDTILPKLYALLTRAQQQLRQPVEALAICRAGQALFPQDAELLFWEGMLLREQKNLDGAVVCLQRLLEIPAAPHFTGADEGMRTYKARHYLGEIYRDQGRPAEAEAQWRAVLAERPAFVPAWQRLAELFAGQGRWAELDEAAAHLQGDPQAALEVVVLQARGQMAQGQFAAARQNLEAVIARAPQALVPRILLSHVLLQEGRDGAAAEEALRTVLRLDPRQEESWCNLVRLLRQERRLAEAFAACEGGRSYCPDSNDLLLLEAEVLLARRDQRGAEACLQRVLAKPSVAQGGGPAAAGYRRHCRHQLALLYRDQKRDREAEALWRALLGEYPDFAPAWVELGSLWVAQGRWAELDPVIRRLQADPQQAPEADLLRARVHLGCGEFAQSRALLQRLIAAFPQAVRPRLALSYTYLQEGRDWNAAEQALHDVLVLDPNLAEARHNLEAVRERQALLAAR
jgi:tetratricopeptide (TPR) repeat protein